MAVCYVCLKGRGHKSLIVSLDRSSLVVPDGPQREQPYNERRGRNYHNNQNNQPLQALNLIAEYLRESEMLMR